MWTVVAALTMTLGQVPDAGPSPAACMRLVYADLSKIQRPEDYRYLIRPRAWSNEDWTKYRPGLVGHLNQISRQSILYPSDSAGIVPLGNMVLRINVRKLGYRDVWDRLVSPYETQKSAYRPVRTKTADQLWYESSEPAVPWPGGNWPDDGRWYGAGAFKYKPNLFRALREKKTPHVSDELVPAVILMESEEDAAKVNKIMQWTGSKAPMVRADWFYQQTAASQDRDPGYPEFCGFADEKDFQKLIGFDNKIFRGFRPEARDAVGQSDVAVCKSRAIVRDDAAGGGYWRTLDFKVPKGDNHPQRIIGTDVESVYDASEQYGVRGNGFFLYGAFDRKGVIQRIVPQTIAMDKVSKSNDHSIHLGPMTCARCHGKGGLQPLDLWFRKTLAPPLRGIVIDYSKAGYSREQIDELEKKQDEIAQQYEQDMKGKLEQDKARYEAAVMACTGIDSGEFAKLQSEMWERYEDAKVDLKYVADEFGMTPEEYREKLLAAIKESDANPDYPRVDPLLGSLAQTGARATAITIRDWEEIHAQAWDIARSKKGEGK